MILNIINAYENNRHFAQRNLHEKNKIKEVLIKTSIF